MLRIASQCVCNLTRPSSRRIPRNLVAYKLQRSYSTSSRSGAVSKILRWSIIGTAGLYGAVYMLYYGARSRVEQLSWLERYTPSQVMDRLQNVINSLPSLPEHGRANAYNQTQKHSIPSISKEETRNNIPVKPLKSHNNNNNNSILSGLARGSSSLIEIYHEVLELLSGFQDTGEEDVPDQMPRIVVVGDQSAGKTSVLEMLTRARIFPRGAGEMMTRSPVMVTLVEGAEHEAEFSSDNSLFNLSTEKGCAALRAEIELRMNTNIVEGQTVSAEPVSLVVRGPGLRRMVLVDLPGVISTVTTGMAKDTREAIFGICRKYMSNPNSIILCIQDASVDFERSNVTDMVSEADPEGKRTFVVLTKVDLAEREGIKPGRIQSLLSGELLPMSARAYHAVVTGRGRAEDTIGEIERHEEGFFSRSILSTGGYIPHEQAGVTALSNAVSQFFWNVVRDSTEEQLMKFQEAHETLNLEWNSSFPSQRIMDRNELFDTAKGVILDAVTRLTLLHGAEWEENIRSLMQKELLPHLFTDVMYPAYLAGSSGSTTGTVSAGGNTGYSHVKFKIKSDSTMRQKWCQIWLPALVADIGRTLLLEELLQEVNQNLSHTSQTRLFEPLQNELLSRLNAHYEWKPTSRERIKSCLQSVMRDRDIRSEREWQQGLDYMKKSVKERLQFERLNVLNVVGTQSWTSWQRLTPQQKINTAVLDEIKKIVQSRGGDYLAVNLKRDDLDNIKKNVSYRKLLVNDAQIRYVWETVLREKQLEWTESKGVRCMRTYHRQQTDPSVAVECHEVTLFHSVQQILNIVSREARIQMQGESQELELRVRAILQALSSPEEKKRLLRGDLVDLSDRIQRVREIIDRLDYFSIRLSEEQEVVN